MKAHGIMTACILTVCVILAYAGCGGQSSDQEVAKPTPDLEATEEAIRIEVKATMEAEQQKPTATRTPVPRMPTPTPTKKPTATKIAKPTLTSVAEMEGGAGQSQATADAIAAAETTEAHGAATAQAIETAEAQAEAEAIEDANYQATADAKARATAEAEYQSTADALADAESVDASQTPSITPCCVAPQAGKGLLWFENHIGEIVEVDVGPTHYMVPPKENGIAGCLCAELDPGRHTVAVHTGTHSGTFEIDIVEGQILRFPLSYQGY